MRVWKRFVKRHRKIPLAKSLRKEVGTEGKKTLEWPLVPGSQQGLVAAIDIDWYMQFPCLNTRWVSVCCASSMQIRVHAAFIFLCSTQAMAINYVMWRWYICNGDGVCVIATKYPMRRWYSSYHCNPYTCYISRSIAMVQVLSPKYQCHDHNTYILAILHVWYLPQLLTFIC